MLKKSRKYQILILSIIIVSSTLIIQKSLSTETVESFSLTVNSIYHYLDKEDLVLQINVESDKIWSSVNFTLEDSDNRLKVNSISSLDWTRNNLSQMMLLSKVPISLEFRLHISNTTEIPAKYLLLAYTTENIFRFPINLFECSTNIQDSQTAGSGAAVGGWGLDDYEILDSGIFKGEEIRTRSLLFNYYPQVIGPIYLNYEFSEMEGIMV